MLKVVGRVGVVVTNAVVGRVAEEEPWVAGTTVEVLVTDTMLGDIVKRVQTMMLRRSESGDD